MFSRKSSMSSIGRSIPLSHDDKVDGLQYGFVLCSLGTHRTEAGRNFVWRLPWSTAVLWRCSEGWPLFNRSPRVGDCLFTSYLYLTLGSPYINAETAGGGLPGWGTYTPGLWRTDNDTYVKAYQPYIKAVGEIIAKNQITNGGPVILVQVCTCDSSDVLWSANTWGRLKMNTADSGLHIPRTLHTRLSY